MPAVNYLAIVLAALSAFVIGGLWYSPVLLGKRWMRAAGLTEEDMKKGSPAVIFGGAFVLSLVGAVVFAFFMGDQFTLASGAAIGAAAGFAWVAGSFGINYLFERKNLELFLINGGYHTVQYAVVGAIIGAMQ